MSVQNIKANFTLKLYKCKYLMLIFFWIPQPESLLYIFALYGGWMDSQTKIYKITWCLTIYKIFSFIMKSTSSDLSRIFHYYSYDLKVDLQTWLFYCLAVYNFLLGKVNSIVLMYGNDYSRPRPLLIPRVYHRANMKKVIYWYFY